MPGRIVTKEEFLQACDAVWTEIEYQNTLEGERVMKRFHHQIF